MGGYNSMKRWVEEEKPRLANLDYTHLNHQGAKRAADIFYQWLIKELESYKKINQDVQKPVKSNHPA
jgi:lysophospholipase L1-like esterase